MELKHYIFLAMTFAFIPVASWFGIRFVWAEKILVAGAFFSTSYLIDINIVSMEEYRGDTRGFEFGVTDWMVISLALVMLFSPRWRKKRPDFFPPNTVPMALYLLLAVLTLFVSYVPVYGAFGLSKILRAFLVYWVAYNYLRTEKDLRFFLLILVAIVSFEFMLVIYQRLIGIYRAHGTMPHSNTLALYMNMINMIFLSMVINDKSRGLIRLLYWAALGMGTLIVLATFSRGALAVMAACYMLVVTLSMYDRISLPKLKVLAIMGIAVLPVIIKVTPSIIERFESAPVNAELSRHQANDAAIAMANSGWLGIGINNYSHAVNNTDFSRYVPLEIDRGIVHNVYLLHAAEMGWIGLVVFLLLIGRFIWIALAITIKRENHIVSHIAIGILAAMLALWLQSSLEWAFRQTYIVVEYFMLAGFLAALPRVRKHMRARKPQKRRVFAAQGKVRNRATTPWQQQPAY
jgi:O-antigen ligase